MDAPTASVHDRTKFFELVRAGGWIGVILLCFNRCCFLPRLSNLPEVTPQFICSFPVEQRLSKLITNELYDDALKVAESCDSFLARITYAGLREVSQDWNVIGDRRRGYRETTALYRKTEPLSMIGNVAPMLGLLGTVMEWCHVCELAIATLAAEIAPKASAALVTTVDGLLVAIPVLVAHSLINMRIGKIVSKRSKVDKLFQPSFNRLATIAVGRNKPSK